MSDEFGDCRAPWPGESDEDYELPSPLENIKKEIRAEVGEDIAKVVRLQEASINGVLSVLDSLCIAMLSSPDFNKKAAIEVLRNHAKNEHLPENMDMDLYMQIIARYLRRLSGHSDQEGGAQILSFQSKPESPD